MGIGMACRATRYYRPATYIHQPLQFNRIYSWISNRPYNCVYRPELRQ